MLRNGSEGRGVVVRRQSAWILGDASELPFASKVAEDVGEVLGEDDKAASRIPPVADDRSNGAISTGDPPEMHQSRNGATERTEAQHAFDLLQTGHRSTRSMFTSSLQTTHLHPELLPRRRPRTKKIRSLKLRETSNLF